MRILAVIGLLMISGVVMGQEHQDSTRKAPEVTQVELSEYVRGKIQTLLQEQNRINVLLNDVMTTVTMQAKIDTGEWRVAGLAPELKSIIYTKKKNDEKK